MNFDINKLDELSRQKLEAMALSDGVTPEEYVSMLIRLGWQLRDCASEFRYISVILPKTGKMHPVQIRCV